MWKKLFLPLFTSHKKASVSVMITAADAIPPSQGDFGGTSSGDGVPECMGLKEAGVYCQLFVAVVQAKL